MTTTATQFEILQGKQTIENYPYGFKLRTTLFMWVEFKKNFGYRVVSQTINPKNGKLNKPKAGTYYNFAYLVRNSESGYVEYRYIDLNGYEGVNKFVNLLTENTFEFSTDESKFLFATLINSIRMNIAYSNVKPDFTRDCLIKATQLEAFTALYEYGCCISTIKEINYDLEAIKAIKA